MALTAPAARCPTPIQAHLEFCENGAKAVAWEPTKQRVTPEFFAPHTVAELMEQADYWLEEQGRLTEPMRYDAATDHYVPIGWDEAFALIGRDCNALDARTRPSSTPPDAPRTRRRSCISCSCAQFGTNNFPDCSNMCHEPTSVGLPESIGIGKGTVLLDDFAHAEAIFIIGQNPGTNSPRMLTELREARAARRADRRVQPAAGARARALRRTPGSVEMATFGETRIASEFCQVRIGGDVAALKGIMKRCWRRTTRRSQRRERVLDLDFIAHIRTASRRSPTISAPTVGRHLARRGLPRDELEACADIYMRARA